MWSMPPPQLDLTLSVFDNRVLRISEPIWSNRKMYVDKCNGELCNLYWWQNTFGWRNKGWDWACHVALVHTFRSKNLKRYNPSFTIHRYVNCAKHPASFANRPFFGPAFHLSLQKLNVQFCRPMVLTVEIRRRHINYTSCNCVEISRRSNASQAPWIVSTFL
jgi:hypothetical protein